MPTTPSPPELNQTLMRLRLDAVGTVALKRELGRLVARAAEIEFEAQKRMGRGAAQSHNGRTGTLLVAAFPPAARSPAARAR